MSKFWLSVWSLSLSISWLLPNHYYPWIAFHSDAWMALTCTCASIVVIYNYRQTLPWHGITILAALMVCVPWIQMILGMIRITGSAWISSIYLLGLVLALTTGTQWERHRPGQMINGLALAIVFAAIVSVGLQLKQWLEIDGLWLWSMISDPSRPFANLAQPNQLATLLLWSLLSILWAVEKQYINPIAAILTTSYLLFGIALTCSRTAWLGLFFIFIAIWKWRNLFRFQNTHWTTFILGIYFVACVKGQALFNQNSDVVRIKNELRFPAWNMFFDAALQKPWLGYGWNQTALAHTAMAANHSSLGINFTYAHNLFLDLMLWCGIPLSLLISACLIYVFFLYIRSVKNSETAILVMMLVVTANHAMLEMPLYYAYFLLPFGLIAGSLNVRIGFPPIFSTPRWLGLMLLFAEILLLFLIIRDYMRVEPSYDNLRAERLQIKVPKIGPPDVLLLTQWKDQIELSRMKPKRGLSDKELRHMSDVASLYPSSLYSHTMATALALNGHPDEAHLWLIRLCKMSTATTCRDAQAIWTKQSLKSPEIAAIPWPMKADQPIP